MKRGTSGTLASDLRDTFRIVGYPEAGPVCFA